MVKAIILAGGYGKRLIPLTLEKPKPLIEIKDKPILQWQIEWLTKQGIKEIVLAVGYLKSKIFETIGDGSKFGVKIIL
jgi:NDP-sugar pyrophosphorylase family protein